jgi:hypothetical protein
MDASERMSEIPDVVCIGHIRKLAIFKKISKIFFYAAIKVLIKPLKTLKFAI